MSAPLLLALLLPAAYLVGAVPFGYLVARARGTDILKQGSGNIGATNVGRVLGRTWGIIVFGLDFAKGAVPAVAGMELARWAGVDSEPQAVGAAVAAFLGHLFPIYLRFRGGKGVATGAGAAAALVPGPFLAALLVWLAVASASRFVSLASLIAAVVLVVVRLMTPGAWTYPAVVVTGFCLAASLLVFARHHANIRRLLAGNENRLKESLLMTLLARTVHVLALGLWFGMGVFFTFVVGLGLFDSLEAVAVKPADQRPAWLPLPALYDQESPGGRFPDPLRKEQGSRIAGHVISPIFDAYYRIQMGCAVLAMITAVGWAASSRERIHRARAWLLTAALAGVGVGWWLDEEVKHLRGPRNEKTDVALESRSDGALEAAQAARAEFGRWHGYSVMVNLATLVGVTASMVLVVRLPAHAGSAIVALISCLVLASPVSAQQEKPKPDVANEKYGTHERNVLDLWKAKSDKPTPLVVFIHGGGFRGGDKNNLSAALLNGCLKAGISVASINYRLSHHAPYPAPMEDSTRAVQYLRSKAKDWNLDPKRVAATGGSAGAGISLWIGFKDDMADPRSDDPVARQSTRLTCMAVNGAQSSYDPRWIKKNIGGKAHEHPALMPFYGLKPDELDTAKAHKLYEAASAMTYVTADDPPVWMFYNEPKGPLPADAKPGQGIHHPKFGEALKEKLDPLKIECVVRHADDYKEKGGNPTMDMVDFFQKHFGLKK